MSSEARYHCKVEPLPALLCDDVTGVSRLCTNMAFGERTTCTLIYAQDSVCIDVLNTDDDHDFRSRLTKPLRFMRSFGHLKSWSSLRNAAFSAVSCRTNALDGVGYRHAVLDRDGGFEASWDNPEWSIHRLQCDLAESYESLVKSSGTLLEKGTRVRILTGSWAGQSGRVIEFDRWAGNVRVAINLFATTSATLDLELRDIEFEVGEAEGQ